MARLILMLLLALLCAPMAYAQNASQFEQQIQQEFNRIQGEMQRQGIAIPEQGDYDGGFSGDDWRDNLDYYHGKKQAKDKDADDAPRFGQDCVNHCLSRGGQPDDCNDKCGEVHDEGVFYDPSYDPRQPLPVDEDDSGSFRGIDYECFRQCRLHGDSFETCSGMCSRK